MAPALIFVIFSEVKVIIDLSAVQQFTLVEIVNITDNMLEEINDQGSFGRSVYKGDQNGLPIAVKVLPSPVGQAELHRVVYIYINIYICRILSQIYALAILHPDLFPDLS
jgi:hypothetical protein